MGNDTDQLVVKTKFGRVGGQHVDVDLAGAPQAREWLGVPFAAPPMGELRWKAPVDPQPWKGIYQANVMPEPCIHYLNFGPTPGIYGSEDCLRMNIYRPDTDEENLPVYFWIHGGRNATGAIREYKGAKTAVRLNAVVVLTQYRLAWLGFINHPALRLGAQTPEDASGNYAYLDMIQALEWVRENISAFGGDPSLVTVAGESAGARNATALLCAAPVKEQNLIQRVICQSGGWRSASTVAEADARAEALIAALQANEPASADPSSDEAIREYLYQLDAETIAGTPVPGAEMFGPIVDGTVFREPLRKQFAEGTYHKVPILLGASRDEYKLLAPEQPPYEPLYKAARGLMEESEIDLTEAQLQAYQVSSDLISRVWRYHSESLADQLARHQPQVFYYQLNWDGDPGSIYQFVYGAAHAMSIVFFQGDWESGAYITCGFNQGNLPGRQDLAASIISYEKQFIRSGDPGRGWQNELALRWAPWPGEANAVRGVNLDADEKKAIITERREPLDADVIREQIAAVSDPAVRQNIQQVVGGLFGFE